MGAKPLVLALSGIVVSAMLFQNCDSQTVRTSEASSVDRFQAPDGLPEVNYFKETPPRLICGKSGWIFMLRNYVNKNCTSCHYSGSFAPIAFGDPNTDTAYAQAQLIAKSQWIETTTHNKFCVPNCDLDPRGEVYQGLMEWADHPNCP